MDLDEDLLALAAGSGSEAEYSEPEQEQEAQEEEEDYYEEDKSLSSRKKRKIVSDDEDEEGGNGNDEGLKNPYPLEGKFKDEADRDRIMEMDDLQRELILFERSQELERFQERKYLELRARKDELNEQERLRSRKKGKTTTKADKREMLRLQRRKAQNKRRGYDEEQDDDDDEAGADDDEDDDEYYRRRKDYDDEDEYQIEDENDYGFADLKHDREPEKETTLNDINNIHIGRQLFAKYSTYPEFASVVTDCYAKVNVGLNSQSGQTEYRMVQIKDVVEVKDKVYTLINKKTNLYVVVSIGKSSRRVPMNIFSDKPINNLEFKIYRDRLEKDNLSLLSLRQISKKYYELREMARRNLTDKEITEMIAKREELENDYASVNIIMKKTNLAQQKLVALENEDFEKAQDIEKQLKSIEKEFSLNQKNDESVLLRVNEKNKKLNQELIRKAELRAIELKLKDHNKDDPFSRLKTRTKMFYTGLLDDKSKLEETKDQMLQRLNLEKEAAESLKEKKLHSKFRNLFGGLDEVLATIDVDIDISI